MPESVNRSQDAVSLDSSPAMAMTTLYSAAVGPIGNDYYLPLFSRFEDAGRATLSWNWSACLYTINWMIFRRLWGAALVAAGAMLGIALALVPLGLLVFEWPHELLYQLLLADLALGMFASGLWGNALLYNHCRQAMMTAVADNKTLVQACAQLSLHASTRRRFIRLLLVNAVLLALVAAAYVRLVGFDSADAPALDTMPAPALAASSAEPTASSASAASAASQAASSAAVESTAAVSAPQEAAALPAASAASAVPASSLAAVAASTPAAVAASAVAAVPGVIAPAAASPATLPTASSALATSAAKPAQAKSAAPVVSHASGPAQARSAVPASTHASATAHPASKAARAASKPAAPAASKPAAHAASKPAAKASLAKAPKTTAAKTSQAAKATPTPRIGLYINAGLFANPDNARNALAKLQAAGLPATAQELETSQGTRTRIRVGPIAQRAQAEATVQQIKALNLDAALVKP